ncbi:hypothetical protein J4E83_002923 [Alternaria metachromatica]|uniref:uncharacterized protein n=1 Tax=Alternaria metachromatica TaxID=283354 RepID=UPI0020C4B03C|nr:uncharacterized protein J4E83_002923 [Alternaria metachromatica]KAI4631392.1 hypothetical protein J4E83_002923 [Alternaria metachromatica]
MGLPEKIETRLFINGEFVESSNGKTFDIINPATLKLVAKVHEASEQDTDNAVAAAKAAFPAWSKLTPDQRGQYFKKLASLIRENNDELAALEASSMGRPIGEFFDAYASAAKWDRYAEAGYSVQGVINIITGFGNVSGSILSHHMDVRALSFTGSSRTGRLIQAAAAKSNMKQVFLELGGKSPAVIFEDADLEKAVKETAHSIQWNSGQVCMANSRIYVQDTVADKYIELFKQNFEKEVKMGDPLDARENGVNHGPQADEAQHKTVLQYLESGKQSGGELLTGGGAPSGREGYYIEPTIFKNTPEDAKIMKEEIFGPVVNINVFKTEDEVLAKANATEFVSRSLAWPS